MLVSIAQAVALTLLGWPFGEIGGRIYLRWKRRERRQPLLAPFSRQAVITELEDWNRRHASAYSVYDRGAYARSYEYGGLTPNSWFN